MPLGMLALAQSKLKMPTLRHAAPGEKEVSREGATDVHSCIE